MHANRKQHRPADRADRAAPPYRGLLQALTPLLIDVAAPIALYYLLHAQHVSDTVALTLSSLIPGLRIVASMVHRQRPDYLACLMLGLFAVSLALVFVTGSVRFLLLKECVGTVLVGAWCLLSTRAVRPMTFYTARPFITMGRPEALVAWERLATGSGRFRGIQQRLSIIWGIGLLVEPRLASRSSSTSRSTRRLAWSTCRS